MSVIQKVKKPAIGLIVLSICNVLIWLRMFERLLIKQGSDWTWTTENFVANWMNILFLNLPSALEIGSLPHGPVLLCLKIGILLSLIMFYGAAHMMAGKRYYLSYSCSLLALLPIISPLFFLGIPIGIWAIYTLNDHEVAAEMKRIESKT